jgi:ABC-type proline/glycine betaine transport system ATPase subunit
MKITHTEAPMITSTGFIPDESTRQNDECYRKMRERKQAKREQRLELLMLLSALESWSFAADHRLPEELASRLDTAVDVLKDEVLIGGES